jgi:hypothetical protein
MLTSVRPTKVRPKPTKKLICVSFCLTSVGLWPMEVSIFIVVLSKEVLPQVANMNTTASACTEIGACSCRKHERVSSILAYNSQQLRRA